MASIQTSLISPAAIHGCEYGQSKTVARKRNLMLHIAMLSLYGILLTSLDDKHPFANSVQLAKVLARLSAIATLVLVNLLAFSRTPLPTVFKYMFGYLVFVGYAAASSLWSPLPLHSIKQLVSYSVTILLSITIARLCHTRKHGSIVLMHLTFLLVLRGLTMLAARVKFGDWVIARGFSGQLWHSTDAADTAGVGIMLIMSCYFFCNYRWAKVMMVPAMMTFISVAVIAHNRFSTALTPFMLVVIILTASSRKFIFWCLLAATIMIPATLIFDAQLDVTGKASGLAAKVVDRDGAAELSSYGGRDELWAVILELHKISPWKGHGFMVTSPEGEFYVWFDYSNWDAHNLILHVLSGLGRIGLALFFIALTIPGTLVLRNMRRNKEHRGVALTAFFVFVWLFLWGLMNVSFGGYINTSHIVFYSMLGVVIGVLKTRNPEVATGAPS